MTWNRVQPRDLLEAVTSEMGDAMEWKGVESNGARSSALEVRAMEPEDWDETECQLEWNGPRPSLEGDIPMGEGGRLWLFVAGGGVGEWGSIDRWMDRWMDGWWMDSRISVTARPRL